MSKHTRGPWSVLDHHGVHVLAEGGLTVATVAHQIDFARVPGRVQIQNARLLATAPELLAAVESEYIFLADIHNEWPGRNSPEGQLKLCRLRDLICKATGREAQDVQDDYGNRNLAKAAEGAAS